MAKKSGGYDPNIIKKEVEFMNPSKFMPISQIIQMNPILEESAELKEIYFFTIKRYISMGGWKTKYVKAEMNLYQKMLIPEGTSKQSVKLSVIQNNLPGLKKYKLNLIADICAVLGYEPEWCRSYEFLDVYKVLIKELQFNTGELKQAEILVKFIVRPVKERTSYKEYFYTQLSKEGEAYASESSPPTDNETVVRLIAGNLFKPFGGGQLGGGIFQKLASAYDGKDDTKPSDKVKYERPLLISREILDGIEKNLVFREKKPVSFLVTATMSAGKSTFINAIVGKTINLSQNLACTSKIHNIVNKAFEDGLSYEYDFDVELDADREILFEDNEKNKSNYITVGTHFRGAGLGSKRCVICDSPGVNSSDNEEHKIVAQKMYLAKKYKTVIYILNATQLGTNDDEEHLRFVKENLGRKKIIFVLNKIDQFSGDSEEENVNETIKDHIKYLESIGFKDPVVCPVSSAAAVLARKKLSGEELSRLESRQLENYIIDFEQMDLTEFYKNNFNDLIVEEPQNEEELLLKQCGISYIEKIISRYC